LQIGQENIRTIRNSTASTISNGRLCMFDGTIGNSGRIKVKPFTAGFNEALYLYGVATHDIIADSDGIITIAGKVRGIDTTGASVGEVWEDEDILYAKPNDSGMMTKVMPADNELRLVVATVIHAHVSGTLEIRFMPFNENMYYTKTQADALLLNKLSKNAAITAGTNAKITYDANGLVTGGASLTSGDIPSLDVSKLTTGILSVARGGTGVSASTGTGNLVLSNSPTLQGATMTGEIVAIREKRIAMPASNIDLATGNLFTKTITATTTFTVSNVLGGDAVNSFILVLTNAGAYTINLWSNIKWAGGTVPTFTTAGVDWLGFISYDNGATWTGMILPKDAK